MTTAMAPINQALAMDVYSLLRELDPNHWSAHKEAPFYARLNALKERVAEVANAIEANELSPAIEAVRTHLLDLRHTMESHAPCPEVMDAWEEFRRRVSPVYERYAASLRHLDIHVPSLRPTNYARNVFHAGNAIVALLCIRFLSEAQILGAAAFMMLLAWSLEVGRRVMPRLNDFLMGLLGRLAHPHEAWRINSATWFCTACFILACMWDLQAASIGIVVLGFADPAAAVLGRRFGTKKLVNGRTLEGTLSFIMVGTIAALLWLVAVWGFPMKAALTMAIAGAVSGGIAELFSRRIDDNLSIPVAAAFAALMC